MGDLTNLKFIYLKAVLLLFILIFSVTLILIECPSWKVSVLLILALWASARIYYFMFYVIEKYVDNTYKFSGIWSFLKYVVSQKKQSL
ncbi:hypothetical protein ACFL27_17460 [candidate division CSSED10-310 bacterium]|uniref:Uncharacterized protein n=1 Tax=candidate division CSSED10-310 bacterium TaxID=2855610 RepID=A0ABV6Z0Z6_UNCC1